MSECYVCGNKSYPQYSCPICAKQLCETHRSSNEHRCSKKHEEKRGVSGGESVNKTDTLSKLRSISVVEVFWYTGRVFSYAILFFVKSIFSEDAKYSKNVFVHTSRTAGRIYSYTIHTLRIPKVKKYTLSIIYLLRIPTAIEYLPTSRFSHILNPFAYGWFPSILFSLSYLLPYLTDFFAYAEVAGYTARWPGEGIAVSVVNGIAAGNWVRPEGVSMMEASGIFLAEIILIPLFSSSLILTTFVLWLVPGILIFFYFNYFITKPFVILLGVYTTDHESYYEGGRAHLVGGCLYIIAFIIYSFMHIVNTYGAYIPRTGAILALIASISLITHGIFEPASTHNVEKEQNYQSTLNDYPDN